MKKSGEELQLSASDLSNHLGCRHATELDRALLERRINACEWKDPNLDVLRQRGLQHERTYLDHLRSRGLNVVELPMDVPRDVGLAQAHEAMRMGAEVIAQAALDHGRWFGRADVLRRVEIPSSGLGSWSYVPEDTKLARETRAGAILQLCLYADLLGEAQGLLPETIAVVSPGKEFVPDTFRVKDFLAYYRFVKARLERQVDGLLEDADLYRTPDPVEHCEVCRWRARCEAERHEKDHLSLVANTSRLQRKELTTRNVSTLTALAKVPSPPWPWKPDRGAKETLEKAREQARVQLLGREQKKPVHELLAREADRGLLLLPEPDPKDLFFDFEGDPFVDGGGLEYLFGWVTLGDQGEAVYDRLWALERIREKAAFEQFMDALAARWKAAPGMHVYHFAPYEPAHLKILAGRHATRLDELDSMLRGGIFVDLFTVVRQSVRASVESYSIKKLEAFYGFKREMLLDDAGAARRAVEHTLELAKGAAIPPEVVATVEAYNRDDCVSTLALRNWLEGLRTELVQAGEVIPRPSLRSSKAKEGKEKENAETAALRARLLDGVPVDSGDRTLEEQGRWLLAQILDFHRREDNCFWWERFRLLELDEDEAQDERLALSGLMHIARRTEKKRTIDTYRFSPQDADIDSRDALVTAAGPENPFGIDAGEVAAVDYERHEIEIRKPTKRPDDHPRVVVHHDWVNPKELKASLHRLGSWVAENGLDAVGPYRAARDLLLKVPPRLSSGAQLQPHDGEEMVRAAGRVALALDQGVLPIQGPPGTGKTYTGAELILDLVQAGKRVGVTANSHKVIDNLLGAVFEAAARRKRPIRCGHKDDEESVPGAVRYTTDNAKARAWLQAREVDVLGGTPFLWARQDFTSSVDVLVVDEAGQLSLANALAVAQAAESLVLLGDPRQLDQPMQARHPDGCAVSALEHLLGDALTVPPEKGLFLAETRRLHPELCAYTSEVFYAGKLASLPGLEQQRINGAGPLSGTGLRLLVVPHEGNTNLAHEEVEAVARLVKELFEGGRTWTNSKGEDRPLEAKDILIVAPYNAQVDALRQRLPNLRIGTVDKFQGQEAPVTMVSLASSSAQEAPRGMEFLYSANRLNVATSRAQCLCILVASPDLFEPDCRTPAQMKLANALCRYREMASMSEPEPGRERNKEGMQCPKT